MSFQQVTPEGLREIADNVASLPPLVTEALRNAASEIEVLKATTEASVKLALQASRQSVADRELMHGMQVAGTELHNKMVAYRANRDDLKELIVATIEKEYPDEVTESMRRAEVLVVENIIALIKST